MRNAPKEAEQDRPWYRNNRTNRLPTLQKIDQASFDPQQATLTPQALWQEITTLWEEIPWGHLAIDLLAISKHFAIMDQLRIFYELTERDAITPNWIRSMPELIAAWLRPLGSEAPDFWDPNMGEIFTCLHETPTWDAWWLDALKSARNRTVTGTYDAHTPCPVYAMFMEHREAIILSRVIIPLPMPLLYLLVAKWEECVQTLAADNMCSPEFQGNFELKNSRQAIMKFPLQICPTVLPQITGLYTAIVANIKNMAA